jgi:hypothetical protein
MKLCVRAIWAQFNWYSYYIHVNSNGFPVLLLKALGLSSAKGQLGVAVVLPVAGPQPQTGLIKLAYPVVISCTICTDSNLLFLCCDSARYWHNVHICHTFVKLFSIFSIF